VGGPVTGVMVRIVDAAGASVPEGSLGELQVRGASVTKGYLNDPESTAALFDGAWLRTGDLALRVGADHFIAGRIKEMAVVNGQNYFPEDAEAVARGVPGVYRQHVVAVARGANGGPGAGSADGAEHIAVIAETAFTDESARDGLRELIRQRVSAELATPRISVHLVAPRWLTRTTSGKWQRLLAASRLTEEQA
jgi:acyl-CoA synthetase (AMP-forming)/AMP-acid ligase II